MWLGYYFQMISYILYIGFVKYQDLLVSTACAKAVLLNNIRNIFIKLFITYNYFYHFLNID